MDKIRIFDIIENAIKCFPEKNDILAGKVNGEWIKYDAHQYKEYADWVSIGLMQLGIKKGDKIATISNNCPEWNFVDMGVAQIGAIHTPIYPTITDTDFEYILRHSDCSILIVSDKYMYRKLKNIASKIKKIKKIYTFREEENISNWKEILELGQKSYEAEIEKLEKIKSKIKPDDPFTLIYTSGTTNRPKGVLLSHWNFMYQAFQFKELFNINEKHKALSFLPLCHVFERAVNYTLQYLGASIYYSEGFHKIADNLTEIRPHIFATVPRVLSRLYDKILRKGEKLSTVKRKLFFASLKHTEKFDFDNNNFLYKSQSKLYDNLIYSQWRKAFGGRIKYVISGGAALSKKISKLFWTAGIPIREGYGLTETAPVITLNNMPPDIKLGSVGRPIGEEQMIKIADDGEIMFKGATLMVGYYKDEKLTKEAIDKDGWFHTGDLGQIDENGFLTITGRKKEIFKLSNGKYVSPAPIENLFTESEFIQHVMVVGENQKFAGALISPNFEFLEDFANKENIYYRSRIDLIRNKEIYELLKSEVIKLNKKVARFEQINTFRIVSDDWSPASGELSPTLKKKRNVIENKYKELINEMF